MNEDGEVLKPPVQLTKLGIYRDRVRDLKFKRGTRGYNQQVFQQIKIIQRRIPASLDGNTVESDLIQIKTDKRYRDVSYLTSKDPYIIQRNSITINKPYIEKLMMGEVSLETSPKNIMIQDMINSKTVPKFAKTLVVISGPAGGLMEHNCVDCS